MKWESFFKCKKVTQLGLGLLGRGVGDAVFLAECGADLIVTDKKTEAELLPSVEKLRDFPNITLHLGGHDLVDFQGRDFILKGAGVPLDSPFIAEARKNNISIEMDVSLFLKLAPSVTTIGVTGTRGKSTVTHLIYHILKQAVLGKRTFLAGNVKDMASLPLLKEVREGDYVVAELDSWQLQGFGDAKMSPHIAVFTTFFPDHLNYYSSMDAYFEDKANIFKYQKQGYVLVVGEQALGRVRSANPPISPTVAQMSDVPEDWQLQIIGEHNRANIASAISAVRALGISEDVIKSAVESFKGVSGRLELIREINGVKIYNDTTATTPEATLAGLRALGNWQGLTLTSDVKVKPCHSNIVLIVGGTDKGLDMGELAMDIPKYCKAVVFLEGTGTSKIRDKIYDLGFKNFLEKETLKDCVDEAMNFAQKGDIILFSPAFASFNSYFKNEYDRGEQFDKMVYNVV